MKESNRFFNGIAVCCAAMIAVSQSAAAEEKPARTENQLRPRPAITDVTMNVKGVGCPFCVYGLEKKLKQVEGVQDVEFNLKTGVATLEVSQKPIPQVDQLREAVKKAGFTLGEIHLTATGSLAQESETYVLNLRESDQSFLLFEKTNRNQVKGYLTEPTRKKLSRLKEEGALASVTGPLHFHAEGAPGLAVEKVVPADSVTKTERGSCCPKVHGG